MFPDNPENLEELVDSLVRRMQAAERLLNSLSDEQREELANLMAQAMEDAGLASELSALGDALRQKGQFGEAIACCRKALEQRGDFAGLFARRNCQF